MQFLSKSQPRFYKHKEVYPKIYMGRHSIYIAKRLLKRSTVKRILLLTGDRDQDHSHKKEMQKSKMAVWGGLTNSCEKKGSQKQRKKGKT